MILGFFLFEVYFISEQVNEQNHMLANIATFCEKGILHQEYDLILDIFQSSYLRGDFLQAAICHDGKIMSSYPTVYHSDCRFEGGALTRIVEKRPYYLKNYLFLFEIPLLRQYDGLFYLLIFCIMSLLLSYWTKLLYKKLKKNLIAPIEELLKYPEKENQFSPIDEINQLQFNFNEYVAMQKSREDLKVQAEKTKAISQTLSMVAHDIKKPFGMLEAVINLISKAKEKERKIRFIQSIERDVKQSCLEARGILDDISTYGKSQQRENKAVSLNQIILDSCVGVFGSLSSYDWFNSEFDLAHTHCVLGNELGLKRAISNIVKNAIEFMKTGDLICIKTYEINDTIRLSITNTGSFIPQHLLAKIFEPYVTENKSHGTGLGLAICATILDQCQGKIWCETEEKVPSATFGIDLKKMDLLDPVKKQDVLDFRRNIYTKTETAELTVRLDKNIFEKQMIIDFMTIHGLRILVVDDEPVCIDLIRKYLYDISPKIEVMAFNKPSEIDTDSDFKIDLAIVDFNLGKQEINGLELIKKLKNNNHKTKFCIYSDWIYDVSHYQNFGINYCLAKPISEEHLMKIISHIISE
ncbi:MAG: ATP-binding protein [Oligoflexales bacterium]